MAGQNTGEFHVKPSPWVMWPGCGLVDSPPHAFPVLLSSSSLELVELAATIAPTHHERVDGAGYPHGLRDVEIPLEGRIAAVCDVFDALTSPRP